MKSISVWVKTFKNSVTGLVFTKASVKGKYLPKADIRHQLPINEDAFYSVKLVGADFPTGKDGLYKVFFDDSEDVKAGAWVDERQGKSEVVRVKGKIVLEYQGR